MLQRLLDYQFKPAISQQRMLVLILIFGLVGALLLTLAYLGIDGQSGIGKLNQPILDWMVSYRSAGLSSAAWLIATMPSPEKLTIAAVIVSILWFAIKREVWRPLLLFSGAGFVASFSLIIKFATDNLRPALDLQLDPVELTPSFPSAHVAVAVGLMILVIYLLASRASIKRVTLTVLIILTALSAFAMSLDRLYLGVHWFTDVIGGMGLACTVLAFIILVDLSYGLIYRRYRQTD